MAKLPGRDATGADMPNDETTDAMLSGYRVLDLGQYLAGAGVTRMLAELGPEIIKVELKPIGDPARLLPWVEDDRSTFFVENNRGKPVSYTHLTLPTKA